MNRFMFTVIFSFAFCFVGTANNNPTASQYHSVKVSKGDGVYSLLRRYKLLDDKCNLAQFYEINEMKSGESLHTHKNYKIPVLIYNYNGKSIRSTIGVDDLQKALRIKSYNEEVRKAKLRSKNFIESKILWVPYHELYCGNNTQIEKPSKEVLSVSTDTKVEDKINKVPSTQVKAEEKKITTINTEKKEAIPAKKPTAPKAVGKTLNVPLFGKAYESFPMKNESLKNEVYYIVSGHGGPDPGAQCTDCSAVLCEDEYAYDVGLRLAKNLMERGATVHVIIQDNDGIRDENFLKCDTDEKCLGKLPLPRNQKLRLLQRTTAINDLYKVYKKRGVKDQKTISIHIDSNTKNKKMDAYFCYYKKSEKSKKLATSLKNTFAKKYAYHQKDRVYNGKISPRGFYILRNTAAPAVLVELANIKNKNNQKRFVLPSNRQALADWLFEGLTGKIL